LQIRSHNRVVAVPDDPATQTFDWFGLRFLAVESNGLSARFALDDLDPYRAYYD
jgi:hypothetical protein